MLRQLRELMLLLRKNLMFRFAMGVAIPVMVVMLAMALFHYYRDLSLSQTQIEAHVVQTADLLNECLRYPLLHNNVEMLADTLSAGGQIENTERIQLINLKGDVRIAVPHQLVGTRYNREATGCAECHSLPAKERPRLIRFKINPTVVRVAVPITNAPDCFSCHNSDDTHLGMLLVDVSLEKVEAQLQKDLQNELLITLATIVMMLVGIYFLLQRLLLRRMRTLREPLRKFAAGDFSVRVPVTAGPPNELDYLAKTFNDMAAQLEKTMGDKEERTTLRERAILEERERIARELHDGFAQLLGYVNTKVIATRLFLQKGETNTAETQLTQLEDATQKMFLDVREAILGLRMASDCCYGFLPLIKEYAKEFSKLSGIPVYFQRNVAPFLPELPGDVELQLLRIVQEALTNVRKHASATKAMIRIEISGTEMSLAIEDNGVGLPSTQPSKSNRSHFGLNIMKERAASIHATLSIVTRPEFSGTRIIVTLPLSNATE